MPESPSFHIPPALFDLSGKVAVVSSAASGMGRASALAVAAHGATVVLLDRNENGLAATAREIAAAGGRALPRVHDTSDVDASALRLDRRRVRPCRFSGQHRR